MFRLLEKINLLKNNKKKKKKKTPGGSSLGSCWLHLPIYPFPNNRCGGKHSQLEAAPQVASTLKRRHFCVLRRGGVFQLRLCLQTFQPPRKKQMTFDVFSLLFLFRMSRRNNDADNYGELWCFSARPQRRINKNRIEQCIGWAAQMTLGEAVKTKSSAEPHLRWKLQSEKVRWDA